MEDWLYEDGFDAAATIYNEKIAALDKIFKPIESRVKEHHMRPHAIQASLLKGAGVAVLVITVVAIGIRDGRPLIALGVFSQALAKGVVVLEWGWVQCKAAYQMASLRRLYRWGNRGRGRRLGSERRPSRR